VICSVSAELLDVLTDAFLYFVQSFKEIAWLEHEQYATTASFNAFRMHFSLSAKRMAS
jgi:hypothetical protein